MFLIPSNMACIGYCDRRLPQNSCRVESPGHPAKGGRARKRRYGHCKSRAVEIDVLFTDIRMPGLMEGLEPAHRVRERWPRISVVIASHPAPAGDS
jgi:CheY-like chemotaxis protein